MSEKQKDWIPKTQNFLGKLLENNLLFDLKSFKQITIGFQLLSELSTKNLVLTFVVYFLWVSQLIIFWYNYTLNSKERREQKCGMKSKYGSITQTPSVNRLILNRIIIN